MSYKTLLFTFIFCSVSFADNEITITQSGSDFDLWVEQVGHNHTLTVNADGDYNTISSSQQDEGHTSIMDIVGEYNTIAVTQKEGGSHQLELDILNDNNSAFVLQEGAGSHDATITLDGVYGTTLELTQSSGLNKSYSLQQNCLTPSGCSVTITQN